MASISSLFTSSVRPFGPFLTNGRRPTNLTTTTFAKRREIHDHNFGRRSIVDENMIVLRQRIHEIDTVDDPPSGWMDWEKDIYPSYDMIICDGMRFLQSYLMETRPSVALGMIGLIALSVPISIGVVLLNLMELSRGLLSVLHVG
ncbi:Mediator of RNA polymerase II transcription subunit 18 [Dorcoceras hygrometricum]|uniref:Mediator of RNA polymerase II transcription subunit 18 n=1 Tax=Dorcoceras hygrometricum TaxID=472368 RepID=A0A2Z7BJU1_9LAMI|nr:Mediator of RNA polymerase II transcription subunit 18 [Dorcoceras hygrometricum]